MQLGYYSTREGAWGWWGGDRELAGNLLDSATPLEGWDASRISVVRGDRDDLGELDAPGPLNKQTKLAMLGGILRLLHFKLHRFQLHKNRSILCMFTWEFSFQRPLTE